MKKLFGSVNGRQASSSLGRITSTQASPALSLTTCVKLSKAFSTARRSMNHKMSVGMPRRSVRSALRRSFSAGKGDVDLYEVLGVSKSATDTEIKSAYRKLTKLHHPDTGADGVKYKEINAAYHVLSNAERRATYDRFGMDGVRQSAAGGSGGFGGGFEDIFNIFGGGGFSRQTPTSKPLNVHVKVTLEDIFKGAKIPVNSTAQRLCEACNGKGGSKVETCKTCSGKGFTIKMTQVGPGMYSQTQQACKPCDGQGEIIEPSCRCPKCNGQKIDKKTINTELYVEKGTPNGFVVTKKGEGNHEPGKQISDLNMKVDIQPHPVFTRVGADLVLNKEITLKEALLGYSFDVKYLDGSTLTISSSPGETVNNGETKYIAGMGLPFFRDPSGHKRGNLLINFKVKMPSKPLSPALLSLIQKELEGEASGPCTNPQTKRVGYLKSKPSTVIDNTNPMGGNQPYEEEEGFGEKGGAQCKVQ